MDELLKWAWSVGVPVVMLLGAVWAFYYRKIYTAGAVADMLKAKDDKYNDMRTNLNGQVRELKIQNDRLFEKAVVPALAMTTSALEKVPETAKT